uniref:Uncharacterized protein n=1 Tax=Columba livia TaxID=8932 RepID=R7VRV0_COLLI
MTDMVPFQEKSASYSIRAAVDVDTPGPDMAKRSLAMNIESVTMLRCSIGNSPRASTTDVASNSWTESALSVILMQCHSPSDCHTTATVEATEDASVKTVGPCWGQSMIFRGRSMLTVFSI